MTARGIDEDNTIRDTEEEKRKIAAGSKGEVKELNFQT